MSLYARPKFRPDGDPIDHAAAMFERHPFATLIAHDRTGEREQMHAVHTPVLVDRSGEGLTLLGHVARANGWWRRVEEHPDVLAIAHGPHAAISASWYEQPSAGTWNYTASHVRCEATTIHNEERLRPFLTRLTSTFETDPSFQPEPAIVDQLVGAIVGVELRVTGADTIVKMSQNKDEATHAKIVRGLESRNEGDDAEVAAMMRRR